MIFAVVLSGGGSITSFIDYASFVVIGIAPFLIASILLGFGNMVSAFSILSKKETERGKLVSALHFFKSYGRITWSVGIIMVIIGTIQVFRNLENASQLGPKMALALVSIFYAAIINIVIVIPSTIFVKEKMTGNAKVTDTATFIPLPDKN
jgi:flagellar motor component MotA